MPSLAVRRHLARDHVLHHRDEVRARVRPFENLASLAVDDLALLVHDVVVLDDMTPAVEVLSLDARLRAFDLPRHQLRLDRRVLVDAEPAHEALHPLAAEHAHQIVLEGQEEA